MIKCQKSQVAEQNSIFPVHKRYSDKVHTDITEEKNKYHDKGKSNLLVVISIIQLEERTNNINLHVTVITPCT